MFTTASSSRILSQVVVSLAFVSVGATALASQVFVRNCVAEPGVFELEAKSATTLVKNAAAAIDGDSVVQTEAQADVVLLPRLLRLGDSYVLTVEKVRGDEVLFASQSKVATVEDLDKAASTATPAAIEGLAGHMPAVRGFAAQSGTTSAMTSQASSQSAGSSSSQSVAAGDSNQQGSPKPIRRIYPKVAGTPDPEASAPYQSVAPASRPTFVKSDEVNPTPVRDDNPASFSAFTDESTSESPAEFKGGTPGSPSASAATRSSASASPTRAAGPEARSTARGIDALATGQKTNYWTIGFGPFLPRHMSSSAVMYNIEGGHTWLVNEAVSLKVLAEGSFSSAAHASASFLNFGGGASYYFNPQASTSPYATVDIGYGFAQDTNYNSGEGFSLGAGGGVEFFRNQQTTLDLLLRVSTIFDNGKMPEGDPSVFGAGLAVNF